MYTREQVREEYQWVPAERSAWRPPKDMTASDLVSLITSATADISIETYRRLYETAAISLSRSGCSAYDIARFQAALDALRADDMHSCSNSRVARAAPHRQVMLQKYL